MSQEFAAKLLERNRVGALLRVFASTPDVVDIQIESAIIALRKLLQLNISGRPTFSRIDFLVSNDSNFLDSDCGLIVDKLRAIIENEFSDFPVTVLDIKKGDIYCMLLNYGVANQLEDRIPYSCIISHNAHQYITQENIDSLLAAMYQKARVAGLAFGETKSLTLKGRITNTFSIWHNKSLITVGGFDLRAAKFLKNVTPVETNVNNSLGDPIFNDEKITFNTAGCEEILPLIRFVKLFGKCIKVVTPEVSDINRTVDRNIDPEGYKRHVAKIATKDERQKYMASLVSTPIEFLEEGLIS